MRVDISLYDSQREAAQCWYKERDLALDEASSRMALWTGVPVIVCCFWIGEITGFSDKLLNKMRRIVEFYDYREIDGMYYSFTHDIGLRIYSRS